MPKLRRFADYWPHDNWLRSNDGAWNEYLLIRIFWLALALPASFWLGLVVYQDSGHSIILDLLFHNFVVGYLAIAGVPLASGLGFYWLYRRKPSGRRFAGLICSAMLLVLFIVIALID